jgi:hypothetical protein
MFILNDITKNQCVIGIFSIIHVIQLKYDHRGKHFLMKAHSIISLLISKLNGEEN